MQALIKFGLGVAGMPDKTVAEIDANLPGAASLIADVKRLEPLLKQAQPLIEALVAIYAQAKPHIDALTPIMQAALPIAKVAYPKAMALVPTAQDIIAFVEDKKATS